MQKTREKREETGKLRKRNQNRQENNRWMGDNPKLKRAEGQHPSDGKPAYLRLWQESQA